MNSLGERPGDQSSGALAESPPSSRVDEERIRDVVRMVLGFQSHRRTRKSGSSPRVRVPPLAFRRSSRHKKTILGSVIEENDFEEEEMCDDSSEDIAPLATVEGPSSPSKEPHG